MATQNPSGWRSSASMTPAEVADVIKANDRAPIGEVHIYLYSLTPDDSQVQLNLPDNAKPGSPNASANRAQILQLIQRELATAMELTS